MIRFLIGTNPEYDRAFFLNSDFSFLNKNEDEENVFSVEKTEDEADAFEAEMRGDTRVCWIRQA